jgi:D-aminopeptidase
VADALADFVLSLPGNESVRSVNPVVGETNDGRLNDIRAKRIHREHVMEAIANAHAGPVEEGNVGAGTGTVAFGFKGGIGTSSRRLPVKFGGYTVGVLVQSNFGGILSIAGAPVGEELGVHYLAGEDLDPADGSIMIIVATDAPLDARNLERLAKRAFMAIARTGGFASNGSGDYVIAFSTHPEVRIDTRQSTPTDRVTLLRNSETTPLFLAAVEATEEAILNSLFKAETMTGSRTTTVEALPLDRTLEILRKYQQLR